MIMFEHFELKECIYTASYKKAHKRVNEFVKKPKAILKALDYGINYGYPNVDEAIYRILTSLDSEQPDKDYAEFMNAVDTYVDEKWYTHIHVSFYFRELFENRYLFSQKEYQEWETRMDKLFRYFDESLVMTYEDYVHDYVSDDIHCDLNHKAESFLSQMRHTYVFHDNPEYHSLDMYDSAFFTRLATFAEEYYVFHEELTNEIRKRGLV